jgi:hypothetical protein
VFLSWVTMNSLSMAWPIKIRFFLNEGTLKNPSQHVFYPYLVNKTFDVYGSNIMNPKLTYISKIDSLSA